MTNKTNATGNLPWKRTLLSTAVALAASNQAFAAPIECNTSITSTTGGCTISTDHTVTITDTGFVDAGTSGIYITDTALDADLVNNGTISASWAGVNSYGGFAGSITNNGVINVSDSGYGTVSASAGGIETVSSSTATNSITVTANGIYIDGLLDGNISNSGVINATSDVDYYANASAGGIDDTATANANAYAYAQAFGVNVLGNLDKNIANSGEINAYADSYGSATASSNGIGTNANSHAQIYLTALANGINAQGDLNGDINNSGEINAYADSYGSSSAPSGGIESNTNSDADVYATASANGLNTQGDLNGDINNSGEINATADSFASAYASANGIDNTAYASASARAYAYAKGINIDGNLNGDITNNGEINASAQSSRSTSSYAGGINSAASAYASGYDYAYADGINIDGALAGKIANTGLISASAEASGARATGIDSENAYGSISNQGTITADAYGYDWADATGISTDNVEGSIDNNGSIEATADATYSAYAWGIEADGLYGELKNSGDIHASAASSYGDASAVGIDVSYIADKATLTNTGEITAAASVATAGSYDRAYAEGIYLGDVGGQFRNDGSISAQAEIDTNAYYYGNSASAVGVSVSDVYTDGTVTNNGLISAEAYAENGSWSYGANASATGLYISDDLDGSLVNNGTISAYAEVSYYAWASATGVSVGDIYGKFENKGTISAEAVADWYWADADATGIYASYLNTDAKLVNSGDVSATAYAYSNEASATGIGVSSLSGDLSNSGSISAQAQTSNGYGSASGIWAGYISSYGSISNTGAISAAAASDGYGNLYASGINISSSSGGGVYGSISNQGSITASVSVADGGEGRAKGINVYNGVGYEGSITNQKDITASAQLDGGEGMISAVGIDAYYNYGVINNSGTIDASATADADFAFAYAGGLVVDYVYGEVINDGTINADASFTGYYGYAMAAGINTYSIEGSVSNKGDINTSATLNLDGGEGYVNAVGISSSYIGSYGSLANTGDIDVSAALLDVDGGEGMVAGITNNYIAQGGSLTNDGDINVTATGNGSSAYVGAVGITSSSIYGSLSNSGSINVDAQFAGYGAAYAQGIDTGYIGYYGSLANSGDMNVSAIGTDGAEGRAYGITTDWIDGTVSNDGNITVAASATSNMAYAVGTSSSGTGYNGTLENNGTISANASGAYNVGARGIEVGYTYGTLSNGGAVSATANASAYAWATGIAAYNNFGYLTNSGSITANANAEYNAWATGVYTDYNYGELGNDGSISAIASAASGDASAYGINVYNDSYNSISNYGSIAASAHTGNADGDDYNVYAVYIEDSNGYTFTNEGSITADATGGMGDNSNNNRLYAIYSGGNGYVVNNGLVSGAIYTGGDYTSGEGSTHEFVVQSVESSDDYNSVISGYGTLTGAKLKVKATADSVLADGDVFENIISAGDLIVDEEQLGQVQDILLLYNFDLVWDHENDEATDDNSLDLVVSRKKITSAADGMYSEIAKVLEAMYEDDTPCSSAACDQLEALVGQVNNAHDEEELQGLLASVLPAFGGQTAFAVARSTGAVNDAILNRLGNGQSSGDLMSNKKVWAKIISSDATRDETNEAVGYDVENGGIVIGVDGDVSKGTRLGFAVAMTRGEIDGIGVISSQNVELDNTQVLVYADWSIGDNDFANFQAGYGQGDNTLETTVGEVDYDTSMFSLRGGYGSNVKLSDSWTMTPELSLTYIAVSEDAYTLGLLEVDERDSDTLEAGVNGKFAYAINDRVDFTTRLGLAYDLLGDETEVDSSFISGPAFSTEAEQDAVSGIIGLGLDVAHSEHTSFSVNYDYMDRGEFDSNTVSAKVNHSF